MVFHHYFMVINPRSGSANSERLQSFAEEQAKRLGKRFDFHILQANDDLGKVLEEANEAGAEVFVAAGGDGTVAAVATEARRWNKAFAVIPSGTANVFAAEHLIPKKMEEAVDLILQKASLQPVDLLLVDHQTFLCHISIGTYSWITTQTPQRAKRIFGRIAYIWNTLLIMLREHMWTFELLVDGQRMRRRASTIMITNAGSMGATGLRWGENISTSDGKAEICILRARNFRHYMALLWAFVRRKPQHPLREYIPVLEGASIHGPMQLPVRADGELIGHGAFEFRLQKHGLAVLMPPAARSQDLH